ncbi:MAG: DUF5787 family protein [Halobacteriota archaeon]
MEFGFELSLCSHLEATTDWIIARQLGAAVARPGSRIIDVCCVVPGDGFDDRRQITSEAIPIAAIESDVGTGDAVYWREGFDCHPDRAREATDRAVEIGFFEIERRGGREYVRQAARYPKWHDRLLGIENKPDLGSPGELVRQLRLDVSLALFDEVILATESYVTRAHLNRIPESVGVWRFDPETGDRTVVREPTSLPIDRPGIEPIEYRSLSTRLEAVTAEEKRRKRIQLAERAYGKGWRTYDFPPCAECEATTTGLPRCRHYDRLVDPATGCGPTCPGFDRADPPTVDTDAIRSAQSPWIRDPDGVSRRQAGLDRFG